MSDRIDLLLSAKPSAAREARQALDGLEERLPSDVMDDLRLLVSELVTNSLRHGGLGERDRIRLVVDASRSTVRVEVSDPGGGFDVSAVSPPSIFQQSGWGLFLVGEVADDWGVAHGPATVVWFEIDLGSRSEAS